MSNEARTWDLLLAESPAAEERLRSGLAYHGEVAIMPYPRNMRVTTRPEEICKLKTRFEVNSESRILLYAPTWRESDKRTASNTMRTAIDLDRLAAKTGSTVIYRTHHVTTKKPITNSWRTIDLSYWPHVEDLISISDMLITDYSSLAYDFKEQHKPVLFFSTDHSSYVRRPGIYAAEQSNRPIGDEEELINAIREFYTKKDRVQEEAITVGRPPATETLIDQILSFHDNSLTIRPKPLPRDS